GFALTLFSIVRFGYVFKCLAAAIILSSIILGFGNDVGRLVALGCNRPIRAALTMWAHGCRPLVILSLGMALTAFLTAELFAISFADALFAGQVQCFLVPAAFRMPTIRWFVRRQLANTELAPESEDESRR